MQPHQTGGQPMNSSQQQELQNTQRQQMQNQMRQQQQAAAAQRQTHQIVMSQGLHHWQYAQLGYQRWSDPAGSQQERQTNSFTSTNIAAQSLLQLQGSGRSQMAGTGGASNVQSTPYMNAASLQQQSGFMGLGNAQQMQQPTNQVDQSHGINQRPLQNMGNAQQMQQPTGQIDQSHDINQRQLQNMGSSQQMQQPTGQIDQSHGINQRQLQNMGSTSSMLARSDTQPRMPAGNTSAQLMNKQKVIDDLKRQLHGQHGGGYAGIHTSSAVSTMPSSHDQSLSGSSFSGQQRQAQMLQPGYSMPNVLGIIPDQSQGGMLLSQNPQRMHMSSRKMMNSRRVPQPGLCPEKSLIRGDEDNAEKRSPSEEETNINESSSSVLIPEYNDEQGTKTQPTSEEEEEVSSETNSNGSIASSSSVSEETEFSPDSTQEHSAGLKQETRYDKAYRGQGDGSVKRALHWEQEEDPLLGMKKGVGVVSASPLVSWKKSAKRVIDLTDSPKREPSAKLSTHRLLVDSSPGVLDHRLSVGSSADSRHSDATPQAHAGLRRSSSTTPQSSSKRIRRSTRESRPPPKLSPSRHTSPRRKKKKPPPPLQCLVYGVETADNDDWSTYGRIARADDIKRVMKKRHTKVLEVEMSPFACWSPLKPLSVYCENAETKKQISGERVLNVEISSRASWTELEPLSVWAKDAARRLRVLEAKRKRNDENVDILADWLVSVKAPRRTNQGRGGVMDETDILMMNNLEDEMQLAVPAFLTSDRETCEKVCAESNSKTDRLDLDFAGDFWARKHFNLPDPGVLSEMELELAWLAEESLYCLQCPSWDWTFIWMHAPPALKSVLGRDIPVLLVRSDVTQEFRRTRGLIRRALCRGYRRPHMRKVIATHKKFLREQPK